MVENIFINSDDEDSHDESSASSDYSYDDAAAVQRSPLEYYKYNEASTFAFVSL